MAVEGVPADLGRLVRAPEADVVGRDDPRGPRKQRDHLPVEERPGRLAVEAENRLAGPLFDVVHPQPVMLQPVRLEVVADQAREALVGRAVDAHRGPGTPRNSYTRGSRPGWTTQA
jgi:hypothetical protein